jgi:GIY-YIG catalytic domain-containing protein
VRDDPGLAELAAVRDQAREALHRSRPLAGAEDTVPGRPGLSAMVMRPPRTDLGLGDPPDGRPLYIGKAEDSLVTRDLKTHFGDGRTGQSTVRRSFAALLHDTVGLRGIPRNIAKPGYFSNYGLSAAHDAALTRWMREHLRLAIWPTPRDCEFALGQVETALSVDMPPLNLQGVVTPWTGQIKAARAVMTEEARAWTAERQGGAA